MADYNRVQIESVYLTDTGLVDGLPCRTEVEGLMALLPTTGGANVLARDRTVKRFVHDNNRKGVLISIKAFSIMGAEINAIIALHNAADTGGTAMNVKITDGPLGDFDLECVVGDIPNTPGNFVDDKVYDVTFSYVVASVNSIT